MKFELIEFKRCCCCIPLRYGMLAAGYIQILLSLLKLWFYGTEIHPLASTMNALNGLPYEPVLVKLLVLVAVSTILALVDTVMAVIFVVGSHKKDKKLLQLYNTYAIGNLVLDVILECWSTYVYCTFFGNVATTLLVIRDSVPLLIGNTFLTVYMILLTRSEIKKLEDIGQSFKFENIAAEAHCAMVAVELNRINMTPDVSENVEHTETAESATITPLEHVNGTQLKLDVPENVENYEVPADLKNIYSIYAVQK